MRERCADEFAEALKEALDNGPSDKTRDICCRTAGGAFVYAKNVDQGPHPATRAAACRAPFWAIFYMKFVDKEAHPATRAVCLTPRDAYSYAMHEGPHKATRKISCQSPKFGCLYAINVDKKMTPETQKAVEGDIGYSILYYERLNNGWFPESLRKELSQLSPSPLTVEMED